MESLTEKFLSTRSCNSKVIAQYSLASELTPGCNRCACNISAPPSRSIPRVRKNSPKDRENFSPSLRASNLKDASLSERDAEETRRVPGCARRCRGRRIFLAQPCLWSKVWPPSGRFERIARKVLRPMTVSEGERGMRRRKRRRRRGKERKRRKKRRRVRERAACKCAREPYRVYTAIRGQAEGKRKENGERERERQREGERCKTCSRCERTKRGAVWRLTQLLVAEVMTDTTLPNLT